MGVMVGGDADGGPNPDTARSPADNPEAFAVGATANDDTIWPGSSRGPSFCPPDVPDLYPELVAPGATIRSTDRWELYATNSGTSLAAPSVYLPVILRLEILPG